MYKVRAKKHLGQHFLTDLSIAEKIAETLSYKGYYKVLEIGPGMGVLTQFILKKNIELSVIELDGESVEYLQTHFLSLSGRIINEDFLRYDITSYFKREQFAIIGNFPYNISTQIVFKMLECKDFIPEFAGMFQMEVAQRICEKPGSKTYGILSVLVQAFYEVEYLFTVSQEVFSPPPKVKSGVLRLKRKENYTLDCSEKLFFTVVKLAFNQRRKTLRNSLKSLNLSKEVTSGQMFDKRPERLSYKDFISIVKML